jgi:hypothetical protein
LIASGLIGDPAAAVTPKDLPQRSAAAHVSFGRAYGSCPLVRCPKMRDVDLAPLVHLFQLASTANEETKVRSARETNESPEQVAPAVAPAVERSSNGKLSAASDFDARIYHAGLVFGAVTLVMALGVIKDVWALLKPSGEGILVFGFLMVRYSSLYRVWFGYALTGAAAWYATIPHVVLYSAGIYGLITRRRWGWMLISVTSSMFLSLRLSMHSLVASATWAARSFRQKSCGHTSRIMWSLSSSWGLSNGDYGNVGTSLCAEVLASASAWVF